MKAELAKPGWRTHLCLYARIHYGGDRTSATLGFLKVVGFPKEEDTKLVTVLSIRVQMSVLQRFDLQLLMNAKVPFPFHEAK